MLCPQPTTSKKGRKTLRATVWKIQRIVGWNKPLAEARRPRLWYHGGHNCWYAVYVPQKMCTEAMISQRERFLRRTCAQFTYLVRLMCLSVSHHKEDWSSIWIYDDDYDNDIVVLCQFQIMYAFAVIYSMDKHERAFTRISIDVISYVVDCVNIFL